MTLATRCPACGTVFRVVQDQLKVSEGWVRCGRCGEVFNAVEALFDLDRQAPPPWGGDEPAPSSAAAGSGATVGVPGGDGDAPDRAAPGGRFEPAAPDEPSPSRREPAFVPEEDVDGAAFEPRDAARQAEAPGPSPDAGRPQAILADRPWPGDVVPAPDDGPAFAAEAAASDPGASPAGAPRTTVRSQDPGPAATPRFVADADRARRWRSPGVRALLSLACLILVALAAAQVAVGARDLIAARWPQSRPAIEALCQVAGCRIEPLRHLAGLTIDGSGLTRLEAANAYQLTLLLRNRDAVPLRLPAFDLTLTDAQGAVVARKVLAAAELGADQTVIAAGSELPLQAIIDPGSRRVVGYTIDLFYP